MPRRPSLSFLSVLPVLPSRFRACVRAPRRVLTALANSGVRVPVRVARAEDLRAIARVVAVAFSDEDPGLAWAQTAFFGRRLPGARLTQRLYTELSYMELLSQFSKRLVDPHRLNITDETSKKHVILIATSPADDDTIVGVIELGMVNVPRLLTGDMYEPVRQWEESAAAGRDGNGVVSRRTSLTPYIGNLAVCLSARRTGVGRALVAAAERHARQVWEAHAVILHVDAANEAAKQLYASRGFRAVLREPAWFAAVGRGRRLFLRKALVPGPSPGPGGGGGVGPVEAWETETRLAGGGRALNVVEYWRYCLWDLRRRDGEAK